MIIPSPYEANDEEWPNPFATIIEDETLPDLADSCHMQMAHYDEEFEGMGHHISSDTFMMSSSYSSYNKEACYT